jgi:alanyl-tRNA synthetase
VLGSHVTQRGSNITIERLRFDFSHSDKVSPEELARIEELVNLQIEEDLPVVWEEMSLDEAKAQGAMGLFEDRYGERVKVYHIGDVSVEICGGPHVQSTGELGRFKITKEEAVASGVRRIRAILESE